MTLNGSSNDPRVRALQDDFRRGQNRFFVTFAIVEGLVLLLAVVLVYGFQAVDQELGLMIIVGIAVLGGVIMSSTLMSRMRTHQRNLRDLTGY